MKKYIKKYTLNSLVISLLLIIFSIFLMIKPTESINFIVMVFAVVITIDGIFHMLSYFNIPKEFRFFNFELVEGISKLILGVITMLNPEWVSTIFPILIGMWIIISSVVKFQFAYSIKEENGEKWIIVFTLSIITFILGLLMVFNPMGSIITITTLGGILLFITEIINVFEYILIFLKLK